MKKGAEAFRSIGEVAALIGVAPHVLRYWETQFTLLKPMKRPDGRRYYRPDDVRLAAGLCELLRDEGLTIRGARKLLSRDRGESVRALGTARLGELLGSQIAAEPPSDHVAEPQTARQAASMANAISMEADPFITADAGFPEESEGMSQGPRSRQRRRRNPSDHGLLPLFPDMAPPPQDPSLVDDRPYEPAALLAALRMMDRLPPRGLGPAERLLAAIRALDGVSVPR